MSGNTVTLSGAASLASYQAAIRAITFTNTGENPSTTPRSITVAVTAACEAPRQPSRDGFAWTVLSALASTVTAETDEDKLTISLTRKAGRQL